MAETIRNILTSPYWAIGTTFVFWIVFYVFFNLIKLKDDNWKRLEYIWLFIGFFAVISMVIKNDKEIKAAKVNQIKQDIRFHLSAIDLMIKNQACFRYIKSQSSPANFDDQQFDQDLVCEWSKEFKVEIDSTEGIPTKAININELWNLKFKTESMDEFLSDIQDYTNKTNQEINKFVLLNEEVKSKHWENFNNNFGPLLLIIAFAIRLTITTRNVRMANRN